MKYKWGWMGIDRKGEIKIEVEVSNSQNQARRERSDFVHSGSFKIIDVTQIQRMDKSMPIFMNSKVVKRQGN